MDIRGGKPGRRAWAGLGRDRGVAQLGAQTLLRLRCAAGDLRGLEWDLLHPAEHVEILRVDLRPDAPGPLAAWRLHHQACLLEQVPAPDDMLLARHRGGFGSSPTSSFR